MHLGLIIKLIGDKCTRSSEQFTIVLEKDIEDTTQPFICKKHVTNHPNGRTEKNRIDIWFCLAKKKTPKVKYQKAIELKYFKQDNHREPNNRADVFKDMYNLEECNRLRHTDTGYMLVYTDHSHYYDWYRAYSQYTGDFDFQDTKTYKAGTPLNYNTSNPHVPQITLKNSYTFDWIVVSAPFRILGVPIV